MELEFLTKEQIKELEYAGVYNIETGKEKVLIRKYNDEGEGISSMLHPVSPRNYIMRIADATIVLDPTYDNILESVIICEAPMVWCGMNTLLKVIEIINHNKSQKKD